MPLDLSALLAKTARVSVDYAGETFWVDYLPHAITAEVQARLAAMGDEPQAAIGGLLDLIPLLVADWEVEDDGVPVAVTRETLGRFPLGLLAAIATAMTADLTDPRTATERAAGTPSSSGASRPALSALPPTGTG